MPVDQLKSHVQIIGNYDVVDKIAEGGMGAVYKARHRTSGDVVAIKVVSPHLLSNPVVLKRFEQEYNVARLIDHPNIIKALDFGRVDDSRYMVMEFLDGESLGRKIERDGQMTEAEAIRVITQVANGLAKAHHQGMIHRDVKPDNVLINADGQVKLTDLGLVKELEADLNLTRTGRGLGTPHFMAPEQFRNAKKADARCDIYSLGATLYMMVTGVLPFQSNGPLDVWMKKINNEIEDPRKLAPDLSERIDWAIRRAMSPDAAQRPETCREFVEDLTGHCTKRMAHIDPNAQALTEIWYIEYADEAEVVHTVKGTTKGIRRSLKEGLLGDASNIRLARTKAGPFDTVRSYPEFRDLVVQPSKLPKVVAPDKKTPKPTPARVARKSAPAAKVQQPVLAKADADTAGELTSTMINPVTAAKATPAGPQINMGIRAATPPETWKWVALGMLFCGAGVFAAVALPMIRHFRLF